MIIDVPDDGVKHLTSLVAALVWDNAPPDKVCARVADLLGTWERPITESQDDGLELFRVPMTVFTTVRAVDFRDALHIVEDAIEKALRTSSIEHPKLLTIQLQHRNGDPLPVHIHGVMETGMAGGNGYLRVEPTAKAYRESE